MGDISNWTAYYERNYEVSVGVWKKEELEISQLCSKGEKYPNMSYQEYRFNEGTGLSINDRIGAYTPGLVYLTNYYTLFDMFSARDINEFFNEIKESFESNLTSYYNVFKVPSKVFWSGPVKEGQDFGVFYVPFLNAYMPKQTNPNVKHGYLSLGFGFLFTKFMPRYLGWNIGSYGGYNGGLTYQDQILIYNTDYCKIDGQGYTEGYNIPYGAIKWSCGDIWVSELEENCNTFYSFISKLKMYPIFAPQENFSSSVNDGISYVNTGSTQVPNLTNRNFLSMLYDTSECPFTPTNGFYKLYTGYFSPNSDLEGNFKGLLVEVNDNGGPDGKNPGEKPDPNDKDPGTGPGGNKGDEGGDGDHNNDTDPIPEPGVPTISGSGVGLFTIFNPTSSQLASLGRQLWNPTVWQALKQYFTDPIETIIGLGIIPVAPRTGSSKNIHLGFYDTNVTAPVVDSDYVIKDCGIIPITRYYGSYLDYDPYTRISLYLPYCGEIEIDPDQVMQKNLGISYHINVVTGDITAIITSNGVVISTVSGNCMRQLPIAQKDFSSIINTAVSAVSTIASAGVSGAAAKSVGGAVAGASKSEAGKAVAEARTNAELKNMEMGAGSSLIDQVMSSKMRFKHAGEMGGGAGQLANQTPYLTIERPNLSLASNYKGYVGYPCNKTLTLSKCSGFTQIEATRLSIIGATDEEITEALSYLVEGVII